MTGSVTVTVLVRLMKLATGVLAGIVTARALGPTGRGEYFVVVTLAAVIVQFANLGLHASNTYLVARDRSLLPALTANSSWISILAGGGLAIVAALLATAVGFPPGLPAALIWFVVALAPAGLFFLLALNLLVGIERVRLFNVLDAASNVLTLALIAIAALALRSSAGLLAASSCAALLSAIGIRFFLGRMSGALPPFSPALLRRGLRYALTAYAVSVLGLLTLRANVFILQAVAGSAQVGTYSIALQMMDVLGIVPASIALLLFPRLVRQTTNALVPAVRTAAVVGLTLVAGSIATWALAPVIVPVLFGSEFARAADALTLLLPGAILLGMTTVLSQFLAAIGLPPALIAVWVGGLIAAVVLGLLLIPSFGDTGAAWALSATYAIVFALVAFLAYRHREDQPRRDAATPA